MKKSELSVGRTVFFMRLLYFVTGGALFITQSYVTIFLREFSFINDFMIGMIMSAGFLITTATQIVFGNIADRSETKNKVLTLSQVGFLLGLILLTIPKYHNFLPLIPTIIIYFVFFIIPGLLIDTIVVEYVEKSGIPFGTVRCFSSAGACAVAFIIFLMGYFYYVNTNIVFILAIIGSILAFFPSCFLPPTKGYANGIKKGTSKMSFNEILHNRKFMLLLCFTLLLFIGVQAFSVFLGVYFVSEDGLNASLGMYGLYFVICIGIEVCLMLYGNRFFQAMDIYNVFTLVSVSACVRSLIVFLAPNIYVMSLSAVSHAFIYAPMFSRLSPYINEIVSKEMRATGQAACSIMIFGIGPMIGSALGGIIASSVGMRNFFGLTAAMLFAVSVVFFVLFKRQKNQSENHESVMREEKSNE